MEIIIASNNRHKIEELQQILPGHRLIPVGDLFPGFDPVEDGNSFFENSMIKANALRALLESREGRKAWTAFQGHAAGGLPPVLADDSGIAVDALNGAPGIYSARFGHAEAGRKLSPGEQNELLLQRLDGITGDKRSARYICCMTLIAGAHRRFTAEESWEGLIAGRSSAGTGGFGYDPIFFLPERNCCVADIPASDKARLSHRAKATRAIAAVLSTLASGD